MRTMPEKRLLTEDDMKLWETSQTKADLLAFIETLANSVKGWENNQYEEPISKSIDAGMGLLRTINDIVENHPVKEGTAPLSRFGKVEFRDFYDEVSDICLGILGHSFPVLTQGQRAQLATYLIESWGDKRRIDYGSGHELNFICFIYGLASYGIFDLQTSDCRNIVLKLFIEYLRIMRILETQYWLEPAGSHGVWGLDDYHFLPFLFGAFQLATHKHLKPKSIHNDEVVEMFADKYLYFGCISFINSVKTTASLRWHSPMLDDISGVKKWSKVAEGMMKMYNAEVLKKLPIMQHFFFSEFLPCPDGVTDKSQKTSEEIEEAMNSTHVHGTWGDCCGIKVPSAVAAIQMQNDQHRQQSHKPIPFD